MTKLYNAPRNTKFTIKNDDSKTEYRLGRIDGNYSICYYCYDDGHIHLGASTEVDIINENNLA